MPDYNGIQKEETLKGLVHDDYFSKFGYEPNIDNIDFVITDKKMRDTPRDDLFSDGPGSSKHFLWAEAKKGTHDIFDMFTQLILTCKKTYEKAEYLAPPWIGVFDEARIAFVSFHDILPIFNETDFNWKTTPNNHETADFQKAREKLKNLISAKITVYNFIADDREIKEFIKTRFAAGAAAYIKSPITKDNFVQIFIKWTKEVKPFINIAKDEWAEFKQKGILDCDFYRADVMSEGGNTITEKLKVILKNDNYKFQETISGRLFTSDIGFTGNGEAYSRFWNKYERPPAPIFRQFIIDRRDLLVPQNIREIKGSFFTPKIWADKSKEYLAQVFGDNWQEEYFVWDCAAGTGNLLAGLTNKYNVWASDIDEGNIETMQSLIDIDENLDLLPAHVFQFDFLNDSFDKLPDGLKTIINDSEKRKKLIVYINPPYAEVSSKIVTDAVKGKVGVNQSKTHDKYSSVLGTAGRELFALFLTRIYFEITGCKIGEFSTLKGLNGAAFSKFRDFFKAELAKCFIVPANTFDNVSGQFPIGFKIWDTENKYPFKNIIADVFDSADNQIGNKTLSAYIKGQFINTWISKYKTEDKESIGYMDGINGNDFQHNNIVYIINRKELLPNPRGIWITDKNLIETSIYLAVRHSIKTTWLNDCDQFLFPNEGWESDTEFQNNCLVFSLFDHNNISSRYGVNHWIPFTEKEINAQEKFESNFMSNFLNGKTFSAEAQAVLDAGRELWKYYHVKITGTKTASVNASFYDIREFFQGRNDKGTMKTRAKDETYNALIGTLREKLGILTGKLRPKVYEYGFLKE
jgi:2-polyprenyl-3-methyl-5-hydroxy-6-metoxy-1,4-benzoquinol methylase